MLDSVQRLISSIRSSQMLRLFSVGLLALLLQIPIAMIGGAQKKLDSNTRPSRKKIGLFSSKFVT
jgi:hypothetical protein